MRASTATATLALLPMLADGLALAQEVPVCSDFAAQAALQRWQALAARPTGMDASDPDQFLVPAAAASDRCDGPSGFAWGQSGRFDDGIHSWIFASRCKMTACGEPLDIETNCGAWFITGECDYNNNIRIQDTSEAAKHLDRHQCLREILDIPPDIAAETTGPCFQKPAEGWILHAEITAPHGAPRKALKDAWLSKDSTHAAWVAGLRDKQLCVYGPLVGDTFHGSKAEVHPAQMLWWRRKTSAAPAADPYDLLLIQDASARYGVEHGYVIMENLPDDRVWRPWSLGPLQGRFEIPFTIGPGNVDLTPCPAPEPDPQSGAAPGSAPPTPLFEVDPWKSPSGHAITKAQPAELQCVSGVPPSVWVRNAAQSGGSNRFAVRVEWACRCDAPMCGPVGAYLGFLRIDATVGLPIDFEEGALGLTVTNTQVAPAAAPPPPPPPAARTTTAAARPGAAPTPAPARQPTLTAQIRRVTERRRDKPEEKLSVARYTGDPLPALLAAAGWSLPAPPVEQRGGVAQVLRPGSITLAGVYQLHGLSDDREMGVKVEVEWRSVSACELGAGTPPPCRDLIDEPKKDRQITLDLPDSPRPLQITAKIAVRAEGVKVDDRPLPPLTVEVEQKLWAERLRLDPARAQGWATQMAGLCPPGERRNALVRLLDDARSQPDIGITTLAALGALAANGCRPSPMAR